MTDESSRPNGSNEPMALDDDERQLLRAAFDPAPARVDAVKGAVVARIAALAAAGAGASAASTASAEGASAASASAGGASAVATSAAWSATQWIGAGVLAAVVAGGALVVLRAPERAERAQPERAQRAQVDELAAPAVAATTGAREATAPTAIGAAAPAEAQPSAPAKLHVADAQPKQPQPEQPQPEQPATLRAKRGQRAAVAAAPVHATGTRKGATRSELKSTDGEASGSTATTPSAPRAHEELAAGKPASTPAAPEPPAATPEPRPVAQPVAESLARELAVLRKARAALERGSALAALDLLDEYDALFPLAVLRQEQLATRALALCAAGRTYEARQVARALTRLAPRSPHLIRLADSCALRETSTSEPDGDDATDDP